MSRPGEHLSVVSDAIVTRQLARMSQAGTYAQAMATQTPERRAELEAAAERHAARQRARGVKGW